MFERLIMLEKGKVSTSISNIRKRHKLITSISTDIILENEAGWSVPSFTNIGEIYNVKKQDKCEDCPLMCIPCGYCLHSFTCLDNSVQSNMCKHIHLVCRKLKEIVMVHEEPDYCGDLVIETTNSKKEQEKTDLISDLKQKSISANDLRQKINAMSQDVMRSANSCSSISKLKSVYKLLQQANNILLEDTDQNKFSIVKPSNEPSNKKITVQRYASTKKKSGRKQNILSKPSVTESKTFMLSFIINKI
ncbi:unnamed protein product [Larinioides sclopetarius]|uniref:SWIM-type domain-containing protein n=1 Tax=Larinioides sclopetarius TaxID=280406 RepID=A0AAV1Z6F4_9ARAC